MPVDVYTVVGWLGVGYSALVNHMRHTLRIISASRGTDLLKVTPKEIKHGVLGSIRTENLKNIPKYGNSRTGSAGGWKALL